MSNIQIALDTINNSGLSLEDLEKFFTIHKGKMVYLPLNIPTTDHHHIVFKQECIKHFCNNLSMIRGWYIKGWCSSHQVIDFHKANDLWFIFDILKNNPERFLTLITAAGISIPLYNGNLDLATINVFIRKLTFSRLIGLYAASFDKRLLANSMNDKVFVDQGGNRLLIKQQNGLVRISERGLQEKIVNPRDSRLGQAPVLDNEGKYTNMLYYEEISKNVKPGFFTAPINRVPNTTPEELATYMVCLDYMDHMHSQRIQAIKSYGILKQHAPDILANLT